MFSGVVGGELSDAEEEALLRAIDDEYRAWSVYDQVIADFGAVRPFTTIRSAEIQHIAALVTLFDRYGLEVPENDWPGSVPTFDALTTACDGSVQAEIDNAALYDELFGTVDNADIVQVNCHYRDHRCYFPEVARTCLLFYAPARLALPPAGFSTGRLWF